MWTEHAPQELVDGKVFPRLLALAEVLWTYPEQRNYAAFYKRIENHYPRMRALNLSPGFPKVPATLKANPKDGAIAVTLSPAFESMSLSYARSAPGSRISDTFVPYTEEILIDRPTVLNVDASMGVLHYNEPMQWCFEPHKALGDSLKLSYEPSPWYTGGGRQALVDGRMGTTNFRDGAWQAVQGKNMEAIVDLGSEVQINEMETRWFMYGNAWIFLPASVEYFVSENGSNWKSIGKVEGKVDERREGEFFEPYTLQRVREKARYVRMVAVNHGPCPAWHDAPGEPSWLFCDELIVR
jgi:hexosaminidase